MMKTSKNHVVRLGVWSLACLSVLVLASAANAQTYGAVTLYPGFMSQTLTGLSGGAVGQPGGELDASAYGNTPTGACRGFIAVQPDHTMTLNSPMLLTVAINSTDGGDTAMVVSGPGGTWCNDDTNGLNPAVTNTFQAGMYSIWIASYAMGTNHPYTITWSESAGIVTPPIVTPPPVVGLMSASMTPTDPMGVVMLATGFMPDPQTRMGTIVGSMDASVIPNLYGGTCRGFVQPNPDHIMNLSTAFSYLRVHVRSAQDTTLVIQDPTGGFWCNDDTDGLNPVIEGPWTPGTWRIWVGTYTPQTPAAYTMDFSEFARQ